MSTSHADLMKDLLASSGTVNKHDHLCRLERRQKPWNRNTVLDGTRYASPSIPGHQSQYSSSIGPSTSQNSPTKGLGGSSNDEQAQGSYTPRGYQKNQDEIADTTIDVQETMQSVILFGIKGSRVTIELAQIDTLKCGRDDLLFWTLKQQYKQRRGKLRSWLSIWQLSHCDFVKVVSKRILKCLQCLLSPVREDMGGCNRISRERLTYGYIVRLRSKTSERRQPAHLTTRI